MDGWQTRMSESECSECASGSCRQHPLEPESVESLWAVARDLSERLLRRQQLDPRNELRVAVGLSLSLLDALESAKGW
jgi:hypothetical protein